MSSAAGRGRGGKFSKPKRGGGKHFSRDLQPLNADGEVVGMWGVRTPSHSRKSYGANLRLQEQPTKEENESSEEEDSSEESSEEEGGKEELTREQRRAAAKARKQAAIAKQNQKVPEAGDLPSSSSEDEDDDMPANPNHTAKARSQAAKPPKPVEEDVKDKGKGKGKQDVSQLSRREREALQAQQSKERYEKMHAEGKTDQARADLERLALVKERREAEAARKKAEAEERAEHEKAKTEQLEREERKRAAAMGSKRGGKGGKKKA